MTGREFALLEVATEPLQSASSLLSPAHVPGSSRTAPPPPPARKYALCQYQSILIFLLTYILIYL